MRHNGTYSGLPNVSLNWGVHVHGSFVEPPDLSPLMELTLSIDDAASFTVVLWYFNRENRAYKKHLFPIYLAHVPARGDALQLEEIRVMYMLYTGRCKNKIIDFNSKASGSGASSWQRLLAPDRARLLSAVFQIALTIYPAEFVTFAAGQCLPRCFYISFAKFAKRHS
jgi:hypothetical protein